jgi:hypothetical protein
MKNEEESQSEEYLDEVGFASTQEEIEELTEIEL